MTTTQNIAERTVCLQLSIGRPGTRAKVDPDLFETDADMSMLHISKDIFDSTELQNVRRLDGQARAYIRSIALPSPLLRGGVHLVPIELVPEIDKKLEEYHEKRRDLVKLFLKAYRAKDGLVAQAKKRLKDLFDEDDYPSAARLENAFTWSHIYISFDTPSNLKGVSKAFFEREKKKAESRWAQAADEVQLLLRAEMKSLVDKMVDKLTPEEGKRKAFRGANVDNLADFLTKFDFRNVTDDDELSKLVKQTRALLKGVDVETIRKEEAVRESVRKGFDELKTKLDGLAGERPKRRIRFED